MKFVTSGLSIFNVMSCISNTSFHEISIRGWQHTKHSYSLVIAPFTDSIRKSLALRNASSCELAMIGDLMTKTSILKYLSILHTLVMPDDETCTPHDFNHNKGSR